MGTTIVLIGVGMVVTGIVSRMIRNKKAGKSMICSGDCKHCGGHCTNKKGWT